MTTAEIISVIVGCAAFLFTAGGFYFRTLSMQQEIALIKKSVLEVEERTQSNITKLACHAEIIARIEKRLDIINDKLDHLLELIPKRKVDQ